MYTFSGYNAQFWQNCTQQYALPKSDSTKNVQIQYCRHGGGNLPHCCDRRNRSRRRRSIVVIRLAERIAAKIRKLRPAAAPVPWTVLPLAYVAQAGRHHVIERARPSRLIIIVVHDDGRGTLVGHAMRAERLHGGTHLFLHDRVEIDDDLGVATLRVDAHDALKLAEGGQVVLVDGEAGREVDLHDGHVAARHVGLLDEVGADGDLHAVGVRDLGHLGIHHEARPGAGHVQVVLIAHLFKWSFSTRSLYLNNIKTVKLRQFLT
jgi:hypothetical protein